MSSLGGSMGEGRGSGGGSGRRRSVDFTGYEDGVGNVQTGTRYEEGTGFDEHGNLKTRFGKYDIGYDPVTGAATRGTTLGYGFPGEGIDAIAGGMQATTSMESGGLGDLFAPASDNSTRASREESGQGVRTAMEQGAFLGDSFDRTGREAEAWHDRREQDPDREGLERPPAHKKGGHEKEE